MNFAQLLFPDFSLILIGHLVCRFTALNRTVWHHVDSLVYYFLFPTLLFHSIVKSPLDPAAASSLIAAGLSLAVSAIALSYSLPYWPLLGRYIDRRDHAASAQVGFRFNSFIALALAERIAGPQGLLMISVLIGFCVPTFNIGAVWPMARHGNTHFLRELLRNPLIIATASGLIANLLGFRIPVWLEPTVSRIGAAALALGLLAAGAGMQFGSLRQGKLLGMYPEGTRSPDGRLYKGKTGLARLALQTGVPVIPVAMIGTDVVNPPGSKMWRFGRVTVRFGKPMDFSRFDGMAGNRFIERAVIDEVMYALMELSGQEYVDVYAASLKETAAPELPSPTSSRLPESAAG